MTYPRYRNMKFQPRFNMAKAGVRRCFPGLLLMEFMEWCRARPASGGACAQPHPNGSSIKLAALWGAASLRHSCISWFKTPPQANLVPSRWVSWVEISTSLISGCFKPGRCIVVFKLDASDPYRWPMSGDSGWLDRRELGM